MELEENNHAEILLEEEDIAIHRFVKNQKKLFALGTLKLARIPGQKKEVTYFINVHNFYLTLNKNVMFMKLSYQNSVSYLFSHLDKGFKSLTLSKYYPYLHHLQEVFMQKIDYIRNIACLHDYSDAIKTKNIRQNVEQHCKGINSSPIYQIQPQITGKYLSIAFRKIGGIFSKKENTNSNEKWEKIKEGTNKIFNKTSEYANKIFSPVLNQGKQNSSNGISEKNLDQSLKNNRQSSTFYYENINQSLPLNYLSYPNSLR